jgi:hypothetical protein
VIRELARPRCSMRIDTARPTLSRWVEIDFGSSESSSDTGLDGLLTKRRRAHSCSVHRSSPFLRIASSEGSPAIWKQRTGKVVVAAQLRRAD